MQATQRPRAIDRVVDAYRLRQRPLSMEEIAQIATHLHIARLTELQRLRDFQRHFEWPRGPTDLAYQPTPRKQVVRLNSRLDHGLPPPTWRPVVVPRNLQELFDTVPKQQTSVRAADSANMWRATRGWAAGALLLLAALFLLRATDRFFTKNYLKWRRNRSEEWPTPNVLATSHMELPATDADPPSESSSNAQDLYTADLPPPYSECSQKHKYEEPPPPYSACYVEFTNPKDGIPAVHFYNSQRQNIFQDMDAGTSSNDTGQTQNEARSIDAVRVDPNVPGTSKSVTNEC